MSEEKKTMDPNLEGDFLSALAGKGFEGMTAGDFPVPFWKILTNGSPEALKGGQDYIKGAEPGMFLNTASKKLAQSLQVIPVKYESVWLEWAPGRGGFLGRHLPGSITVIGDPYTGMKTKEGNEVTDAMVFYILDVENMSSGLAVLSLQSSGIRHGKAWNQKIRDLKTPSGAQAPFFGGVWKLELALNENDKGAWWTLGKGKETTISFVRYIERADYENFVGPSRTLLDTQRPMLQIEYLRDDKNEANTDDVQF